MGFETEKSQPESPVSKVGIPRTRVCARVCMCTCVCVYAWVCVGGCSLVCVCSRSRTGWRAAADAAYMGFTLDSLTHSIFLESKESVYSNGVLLERQ